MYLSLALALLLSTASSLSAEKSDSFIDLGVQGVQYDIIEENGADLIEKRLKDINSTKVIKSYSSQISSAFHSRVKIKTSKKDTKTKRLNIQRARWDIVSPNGDIILRKGEIIPASSLNITPFSICFIDGGEEQKVVEEVISNFGRRCKYMVNNIDAREFSDTYNLDVFPMGGQNKTYLEYFKIKTVPTMVEVNSKDITTTTLNMIKIYQKVRNENLK